MTFDQAHRLIKNGDLVSLRHELDAGTSANLVNQFSWTLLMLAAFEGNTTIGKLLISRGATIDKTNDFGETALSLAAHARPCSIHYCSTRPWGLQTLSPAWTHSGRLDEGWVGPSSGQD
jgi:Ankyrin repeats (3 copies)